MAPQRNPTRLSGLPIPLDFAPMEALRVDELPSEQGWQFEPKWDGFRCLAFRAGTEVELKAKSGKTLARYFPEMVGALRALRPQAFVIDGELVIPAGKSLSFEALQLRLHPAASRVAKLAAETPAVLILFDMLMAPDGTVLTDEPLPVRRAALDKFFKSARGGEVLRLSPTTRSLATARKWLKASGMSCDGVIAKRIDDAYRSGERAMLKVKRIRSADCVVGGFRYGTNSKYVASLLLGLYDGQGRLDHVGFTTNFPDDRAGLTRKLLKISGEPGFTGDAPGGPSRWSTERSAEWTPLKPKLVVEVRYDHVTGGRFRHGASFLRWRPDKAPRQCTRDQLNG
jgi:ATP-dependent DNA ligase